MGTRGRLDVGLLALLSAMALTCAWGYQERARLKSWAERLDSFLIPEDIPIGNTLWSLFIVSVASLYLEIMLIRWIGTEVRIFAYFQNLALIACFLGFGLGCYWSRRRRSVLISLAALAALVLLVCLPIPAWKDFLRLLSNLLSLSSDADLWGMTLAETFKGETLAMLAVLAVATIAIFLLVLVAAMVPLGQWVGYYLDTAPDPIQAYSTNLLGSAVGLWIFAGLAFLWLPPEYWFGLALLLCLLIRRPSPRLGIAALAILVGSIVLLRYGRADKFATYWSPYQKLEVYSLGDDEYSVTVNSTAYMSMSNLRPGYLAQHPELAEHRQESSYDAPFRFAKRTDRVLIVGAGAGNDAAAALRNGAQQVDTVEIDPVIYFLGTRLHPDQPYSSPKVHKILGDAREFLRRGQDKYDVVLFGLLDSHAQFSNYSNMRVDNYVYTEQAFREARRLLKPDGVLVLKFEVRAPWTWMGQRFYVMLDRIFGRPPVTFHAPPVGTMSPASVFIVSDDADLWTRAQRPELAQLLARDPPAFPLELSGAPPPTTDDWPYVYHRSHSIPRTYFTISVILLALALALVGRVLEPTRVSTWHFFFLGAGFLLLETQLVSRLALYFGSTWVVNSVALTTLLIVLMVANVYVARVKPKRLGPYYVLLILFLLANYLFPWQTLPYAARTVGVLLSAAYSLPVFFAGVIFTDLFRRFEQRSSAFGANIVGAVAGGLAQNASFIVGMKALLLIAIACYAAAAFCGVLEARRGRSDLQPTSDLASETLTKA